MGGGDNEITISAILDAVGFQKGTKKLESAIKSLGKTAENTGKAMNGSVKKFGLMAKKSLDSAVGSAKRLIPMLIGVSSVYGILSKAVNSYMSQNQQLSAQMTAVWTALGNLIGPIIEQIVYWVSQAISYFIEFLRLLGVTSKTASQLSKQANKAGGDLKKTLAGFDELNLLNDNKGPAEGRLSDVDPADWIKKIFELLRNGLWDEATDIIIEKMNAIIAAFKKKATEFGKWIGTWLGRLLHMIARIINEPQWSGIGEGIAGFLLGATDDVNGEDIGAILVAKFTIGLKVLTGFLSTPGLGARLGKLLGEAIVGAINSITAVFKDKEKMRQIGTNIKEFFENLPWEDIKDALGGFLKTAWDAALEILWGYISGNSDEEPPVVTSLRRLGESVTTFIDVALPKLESFWTDTILPFIEGNLPKIIDDLATTIDDISSVLNGDKSIWDIITEGLTNIETIILVLIEAKVIGGILALAGALKAVGTAASIAAGVKAAAGGAAAAGAAGGASGGGLAGLATGLSGALVGIAAFLPMAGLFVLAAGGIKDTFQKAWEDMTDADSWKKSWEEMTGAFEQEFVEPVKGFFGNVFDSYTQMNADMLGVSGDWKKANEEMAGDVSDTADSVDESMGNITTAVDQTQRDTGTATDEMVRSWQTAGSDIETTASNTGSNIETEFTSLNSAAETWGQDLVESYTAGLINGEGGLYAQIDSMMQEIYEYMHFSEPDKGPLADFHTWAPDMMKGFAEGIEKNKSKVMEAVSSVASGISGAMSGDFGIGQINLSGIDTVMDNFADRIVSGFENMLSRLQAIADNVNFTMPAVASGTVMPYSIGVSDFGAGGYGQSSLVDQISDAVYDAVVAALSNSQEANGQRQVILQVNGREFCRATYYDQQAVAKEHGVSLITNG